MTKRTILILGFSVAVLLPLPLASLLFSADTIGRPFPGFLVYSNGVLAPFALPSWFPQQEGVTYPWAVESMDDHPVPDAAHLAAALSTSRPGEIHMFTFIKDGVRMSKGLPVMTFTLQDFVGISGPMWAAGMIIAGIGVYIAVISPWTPFACAFMAFCLAVGGWFTLGPDWMLSHRLGPTLLAALCLIPGSLVCLALTFPTPPPWVRRHLWSIPAAGAAVCVPLMIGYYRALTVTTFFAPMESIFAFALVVTILVYGMILVRVATHPNPHPVAPVAITSLQMIVAFAFFTVPLIIFVYFIHAPSSYFTFLPPVVILLPLGPALSLRKIRTD